MGRSVLTVDMRKSSFDGRTYNFDIGTLSYENKIHLEMTGTSMPAMCIAIFISPIVIHIWHRYLDPGVSTLNFGG